MLPSNTPPLIALLTDFGTSDPYVGVMKGVMLSRCSTLRFIDITHEISPQNVAQGAYLLRTAYRYFPSYTVFLAVVDPGVGTERKPVAIKTSHGVYVGPDNGLFAEVLAQIEDWHAVVLWPPEHMSSTFHGRDVFAPAAADLACGKSLNEIGTPTADLIWLPHPVPIPTEVGVLTAHVIHIDHFGNIVTNLGPFSWKIAEQNRLILELGFTQHLIISAADAQVSFKNHRLIGLHRTYGETKPGDLLALINSDNHLEIAVNQGNAARLVDVQLGDPVQLKFSPMEL